MNTIKFEMQCVSLDETLENLAENIAKSNAIHSDYNKIQIMGIAAELAIHFGRKDVGAIYDEIYAKVFPPIESAPENVQIKEEDFLHKEDKLSVKEAVLIIIKNDTILKFDIKIKRREVLEVESSLKQTEYGVILDFERRRDAMGEITVLDILPKIVNKDKYTFIRLIDGTDYLKGNVFSQMTNYIKDYSVCCVDAVFGKMIDIYIEFSGIDFSRETGPHNGFCYNDFRRVISDIVIREYNIKT